MGDSRTGNSGNRPASVVLALCLLLGTLGCSGGDSTTPHEQCMAFQSAYCSRAIECDVPSDRTDQAEACDFFWQVYSECDRVTEATLRLPLCMKALDGLSCDSVSPGALPDFPGDCSGIFYE